MYNERYYLYVLHYLSIKVQQCFDSSLEKDFKDIIPGKSEIAMKNNIVISLNI